jgi:hypothetical protein
MTLPRGVYYQDSAARTLLDSLVLMLYDATPRAPDTAWSRRIKLQKLLLLRIDFQRMSAASVFI